MNGVRQKAKGYSGFHTCCDGQGSCEAVGRQHGRPQESGHGETMRLLDGRAEECRNPDTAKQ